MFGEYVRNLLQHNINEVDAIARILMHRDRPKAIRKFDQIYMLVGSQLTQAKLISEYVHNKRVVFMGDDDCMSLTLAVLAHANIGDIRPPSHITVFDFDEGILKFIRTITQEYQLDGDHLETVLYNVQDPIPEEHCEKADVFYTNPPYGFSNAGQSGRIFLQRCMEMCEPTRSRGVAILPYDIDNHKASAAMTKTQEFLVTHGYVISEMLRGMHQYDLDDRPRLWSGTVVLDRIEHKRHSYFGKRIPDEEFKKFFGNDDIEMPHYVMASDSRT